MCQIINLRTTPKKLRKIKKDDYIRNTLQDILAVKGGDYYSGALQSGEESLLIKAADNLDDIIDEILKFLKLKKIKKNNSLQVLLFSRQRPEMETEEAEEQPYILNVSDNRYIFAVHGTIYNDRELAQKLNIDTQVDTEILKKLDVSDWDQLEGSFAVLGIDCNLNQLIKYEAGLKIWESVITRDDEWLADIYSTTSLIQDAFQPTPITFLYPTYDDNHRTLFVSFSGGMDISLSTFKELSSNRYKKMILNYFAWGSKAEEMETLQLEKFKDFYSKEFPGIEIDTRIWEATNYFNEYFDMNGAALPKISISNIESEADELETESPLAYVPYRNTQFAILLASKAEALQLKEVDFLFGLNLSEGMVFMDNSEGWLDAITQVVQYGGIDFKLSGSYRVVAPYFPRTKTNMIKEFQEEFGYDILSKLLDLSKSCYYPDENDKPCGKCGSCILREKALSRINK